MAPRTKQQQSEKKSYKKIGLVVVLGAIAGLFFIWNDSKKVEKNIIYNYVCEIVVADSDSNVMGMRCMIK